MQHPTRFLTRTAVRWFHVVIFALWPLTARDALAQTTVDQWPGLAIARLPTVYVHDASGHETRGGLVGLTEQALFLVVEGEERRFDRTDVARLETRDSLKNGAWMGAVLGTVFGLVSAGISDCPIGSPGGGCGGLRATLFVTSVGVYTAIGTAVDAAIGGRSTLYEAPTTPGASRAVSSGPRPMLRLRATW